MKYLFLLHTVLALFILTYIMVITNLDWVIQDILLEPLRLAVRVSHLSDDSFGYGLIVFISLWPFSLIGFLLLNRQSNL